MPELPEVETVARGLRRYVQGQTIQKVRVVEKKKFRGTPAQLHRVVYGQKISAIERRGKWLVLQLTSHYGFVIHLKMTGQLLYDQQFLGGHTMGQEQFNSNHTRVIFELANGGRLFFQDMRKFGYVELYSPTELADYFVKKKLGIEPFDSSFTFSYWKNQLRRHSNTSVKALLLNQSIIAGIGNIYADDICWTARVRPQRRVRSLRLAEQQAIVQAIKKVLAEAITLGGTSFSHYYRVDGQLGQYWQRRKVYGRTGERCRRCHQPIKKIRCAGRGTHYCAACQS
ncbi:MAG: bifunctional DNA-formamidopyrimidine glycosylase/DNA-(apurinic or apyrimidinic site) lyase [Candidatus Kerfeldbacteria bacterium]|nr:bifunctional DNA-formamidopyrimidine glycosylase/DNA-(apurinic or apyrimidinic site) lyase [Candidatus Kerfeldbacteria bacterium]